MTPPDAYPGIADAVENFYLCPMMRTRILPAALAAAILIFSAVSVASAAPIKPKEARDLLAASSAAGPASANKGPLLLDVRTLQEFNEVRIPGAVLLPVDRIDAATAAAAIGPWKDRTVIVYCRSGNRSRSAVSALARLGYTKLYDLGGIIDWPYETVRGAPK